MKAYSDHNNLASLCVIIVLDKNDKKNTANGTQNHVTVINKDIPAHKSVVLHITKTDMPFLGMFMDVHGGFVLYPHHKVCCYTLYTSIHIMISCSNQSKKPKQMQRDSVPVGITSMPT